MNVFKRLALIVSGLAGVLCLAALLLPWVGPYQREATMLMDDNRYWLAIQILAAITALVALIMLLRGLFTPRRRKTVVIDRSGKDQISVSTAAIQSQATHVVEGDGRFVAEKVRVSAKGKSNVQVDLRVRPRNTVDLSEEGRLLHDRLMTGLAVICGDKVRRVNIQFVEAESPAPAQDVLVENVEDAPQELYGGQTETQTAYLSPEEEAVRADGPLWPQDDDELTAPEGEEA